MEWHKMRGAVIYTRVSTDEQVQHGTSLDGQRTACLEEARRMGLPVVAECEDSGISGSLYQTRPGIMEALRLVESGAASVLIATKIDRIGRSARVILDIVDRVEKAGGELVTGDMKFDHSPTGRLMRTIYAGMAEMEREAIRERTMGGKRRRAEDGQQPQRSRSPYGYHIITNAEVDCGLYLPAMRGQYIIDEEKATIARRLFTGYANGTHSLPLLCKELNAEGILAPSGGLWHEPTIRVILTNPVYKGEPVSGRQKCHTDESRLQQVHALTGMPIMHPEVRRLVPKDEQLKLSAPPLVSEEMWNTVQERLIVMKAKHGGNPKRLRMLSGLCFCPNCGERTRIKYQQANGKKYCYYWCGARSKSRNFPGERLCLPDLYSVSIVEKATVKAVQEAWERPDAIAAALAIYQQAERQTPVADLRRELEKLDKALAQVKAEEVAAVQAQISGIMRGLSPDAYAEAFASIAARRKDMENRRGVLAASLSRSHDAKAEGRNTSSLLMSRVLADAVTALTDEDVTEAEKRLLLGTIIEKVIPHKEGADVYFAPSIFQEAEGEGGSGSEKSLHTFHTTCMGISTHK